MASTTNAIPARITAATAAAAVVAQARDRARLTLSELQAELADVTARKAVLDKVLTPVQSSAWCADLTEDATGSVATLDLPDEGRLVLIAPAAPAPVAADGTLAMREALTSPQAYWCAAALPGVQKWRPNYRRGVITALDKANDTADVTLDATDTSSAQGLNINQVPTLSAVPVQYMTCNSQAFEVGDRCVVRFVDRDWTKPRVVGFESHPKACDAPDLHLIFWEPDELLATDAAVRRKGPGGLHSSGVIDNGGVYRSLGISLATGLIFSGMHLDDVGPNVSYQIPGFYDGYPVLLRSQSSSSSSSEILNSDPASGSIAITSVVTELRTLRWGNQVYGGGSYADDNYSVFQLFQPPYSATPNSIGAQISADGTQTYVNFPSSRYISETQAGAHPATIRSFGPWQSWSVLATYVIDGVYAASSQFEGAPVVSTDTRSSPWRAWNLPPPRKGGAGKPRADLALMPARLATGTPRTYTSAGFVTTPLDRHLIDFGYLPYTVDSAKVYAVGKNVAWCWLTEKPLPGSPGQWVNISAVNYKTGVVANVSKPEFFTPDPLPASYIPPNVVLTDTWAALCKNDEITAHFWVWIYTLNLTAGTLTVTKTITNKPGDLSAGGHVGLVQVSTPSLPADAVLVGAMRDEVVCM